MSDNLGDKYALVQYDASGVQVLTTPCVLVAVIASDPRNGGTDHIDIYDNAAGTEAGPDAVAVVNGSVGRIDLGVTLNNGLFVYQSSTTSVSTVIYRDLD